MLSEAGNWIFLLLRAAPVSNDTFIFLNFVQISMFKALSQSPRDVTVSGGNMRLGVMCYSCVKYSYDLCDNLVINQMLKAESGLQDTVHNPVFPLKVF